MPNTDEKCKRIVKLIAASHPDKADQPDKKTNIYVDSIDQTINISVPDGCQTVSINLKLTTK